MTQVLVGRTEDIPPGERRIVDVAGQSVGLYNFDGSFFAVINRCPHRMLPVCEGQLGGTFLPSEPGAPLIYALEGRVITCPAHRWQFDITNGLSITEPERVRVRTYEVTEINGELFVESTRVPRPAGSQQVTTPNDRRESVQ